MTHALPQRARRTLAMIEMFVIYDHPKDFPEHWVVRSWIIVGGEQHANRLGLLFTTVELARQWLRENHPTLTLLQSAGQDPDPVVHEVWA